MFLKFCFIAKRIFEPSLDEIDGEIGDINANPSPPEFVRRVNGGPAAAEGIEDDVALVGARFDDAFEERLRFLCRIAEALVAGTGKN